MIKNEATVQEVVIQNKYCDDCGKLIPRAVTSVLVAKCEICGKDLCNKCVDHEVPKSGDTREVYCKRCWTAGKPYREKIEKSEYEIEVAINAWYEQCRVRHCNYNDKAIGDWSALCSINTSCSKCPYCVTHTGRIY